MTGSGDSGKKRVLEPPIPGQVQVRWGDHGHTAQSALSRVGGVPVVHSIAEV